MSGNIFEGLVFCYAGVYKSLYLIKNDIVKNGGEFVSSLNPKVTHLVTTDSEVESRTSNIERAIKYGIYIVSEQWVEDCLEKGVKLPENSYFLTEEQPKSNPALRKSSELKESGDRVSQIPSFAFSPLKLQTKERLDSDLDFPGLKEEAPKYVPKTYSRVSFQEEKVPQAQKVQQVPSVSAKKVEQSNIDGSNLIDLNTIPKGFPIPRLYKANDNSAPSYPAPYQIIIHKTLQLSDLSNNNNKYYSIELHYNPSSPSPYRVFTHYGRSCDLEKNPNAGVKEMRFFSLNNEIYAKAFWQKTYNEKTKKGYVPVNLLSSNIGSEEAKKANLPSTNSSKIIDDEEEEEEEEFGAPKLSPELADFISFIYQSAEGALTAAVNAKITARGIETPLGVLTLDQINKGEEILQRIDEKLKSAVVKFTVQKDVEALSNQFYSLIPHKFGRSAQQIKAGILDSSDKVEQKLELTQLMKDMLTVIEGRRGRGGNALDLKYHALQSLIKVLEHNSEEFRTIEKIVLESQLEKFSRYKIKNILAVSRSVEEIHFTKHIPNQQYLFHGSRTSNFVGLLSRGLLMPKLVVSRGGGRTDVGLLGNGIYFTDSLTSAAQYAHPDPTNNSRLMLINKVALGKIMDYTSFQIGRTAPPSGFESIHGVRRVPGIQSEFKDDEFVVFDEKQQQLQYVVEFETIDSPTEPVQKSFGLSIPDASRFFSPASRSQPKPLSRDVVKEKKLSPFGEKEKKPSPFGQKEKKPSPFAFPNPDVGKFSKPLPTKEKKSSPFEVPKSQVAKLVPKSVPFKSNNNNNSTLSYSKSNQEIKAQEDYYRELFVNDRDNRELSNPYVHLINVLDNRDSTLTQRLDSDELPENLILTKYMNQRELNTPAIVSNNVFLEKFGKLTENQFNGLNWDNIFIAGGAVLRCLLENPFVEEDFNTSDIDIFLYGLSKKEANEKILHIYNIIKRNTGKEPGIVRTTHAITIIGEYPYRHVQIILRLYKSPAEVLMGFDVDCCCVGYNGSKVFALPRAVRAMTKRYNLVDFSRRSLTYEIRLHKYSKRGFGVYVPQLDWSKVNENLYHRKVADVTGLAKLLILHRIQMTGLASSTEKKFNDTNLKAFEYKQRSIKEDCDYSNIYIPWGPSWTSERILRNMNMQDKFHYFNKLDTKEHTHLVITGINNVFEGYGGKSSSPPEWCYYCKERVQPLDSDKYVKGPIAYLTENPGSQFLTGSFHPVNDDQWFDHAYAYWQPIPGAHFIRVGSKVKRSAQLPVSKKNNNNNNNNNFPTKGIPKQEKKGTSFGKAKSKFNPPKATRPSVPAVPAPKFGKPTASSSFGAPSSGFGAPPVPFPGFSFGSAVPVQSGFGRPPQSGFGVPSQGGFGSQPLQSGFGQPPQTGFGQPPQSGFGSPSPNLAFGRSNNLKEIVTEKPNTIDIGDLFANRLNQEVVMPESNVSKLLLLLAKLVKDGLITSDERGTLKDLIIRKNPSVVSVLEVFEIERDFNELADSLRRICKM